MNKKILLLLSILLCSPLSAVDESSGEQRDLIEAVTVDKNKIHITINKEFRKKYLLADFFAKYEDDIDLSKLDYSIQIMPFIMNVVSIVWISGKDYYIDSMDEQLYTSLEKVKEVFLRMYKKTRWTGRLIPRKLVKNTYNYSKDESKIALLFSGGLDSTTSSLYHKNKKQLLVTVWGHWDLPLHDKKLWKTRKEQLREFGALYGHENSFIKSNYYSFLNRPVLDHLSSEISSWRIFTVEGIGWAGLVAPLLLLKGYPVLYHASTVTWDFTFPAAANPFIDDNLKFAQVGLKHDLFDMNRIEKCEFLAHVCKKEQLKKPFVRVCEEKIVENCCRCQKCVRTILEFAVINEDPRDYGFDGDIEHVLKKSKSFMQHHTTGATTVWHFKHLQEKLQEKSDHGEPVHPDLAWILTFEVDKKVTTDIKHQRKIDWFDYVDLLPEIEIPKKYKQYKEKK